VVVSLKEGVQVNTYAAVHLYNVVTISVVSHNLEARRSAQHSSSANDSKDGNKDTEHANAASVANDDKQDTSVQASQGTYPPLCRQMGHQRS
jgi:hypothetical protein